MPNNVINNSLINVTAAPPVNFNPMPMPVYTDMFNMQPTVAPIVQPTVMPMFTTTVAPMIQPTVTPMFTTTVTQTVPPAMLPIVPQQATANSMNMLGTNSISPVAPPSVINPFSGLDPLDSFGSSGARATKAAFAVSNPVPKTIQELQMQQNVSSFLNRRDFNIFPLIQTIDLFRVGFV